MPSIGVPKHKLNMHLNIDQYIEPFPNLVNHNKVLVYILDPNPYSLC